jgi:hypothetical protein
VRRLGGFVWFRAAAAFFARWCANRASELEREGQDAAAELNALCISFLELVARPQLAALLALAMKQTNSVEEEVAQDNDFDRNINLLLEQFEPDTDDVVFANWTKNGAFEDDKEQSSMNDVERIAPRVNRTFSGWAVDGWG